MIIFYKIFQQFDELLGNKLFQKSGRQKKLSALGHELFIHMRSKWQDYDLLIDSCLSGFDQNPQRPVRLFGPLEILSSLAERIHSPLSLYFVPARSISVLEHIKNQDLSLGISRLLVNTDDIVARKLFHDEFCLVFPSSWKIDSKNMSALLLQELSLHPVYSYGEDFKFLEKLSKHFKLKKALVSYGVIPHWQALYRIVEQGRGWIVSPQKLVPKNSKISIVKIPVDLYPTETYYLVYKKSFSKIKWFKELTTSIVNCYKFSATSAELVE